MLYVIINITIFIISIISLKKLANRRYKFSTRVLLSLFMGIIFGYILNKIYGNSSEIVKLSTDWFSIVGNGYVALLKMLVIPLVFISILSSIVQLKDTKEATTNGGIIISTLLITTGIAAVVGIFTTLLFGLNANQILPTEATIKAGERFISLSDKANAMTLPQRIVDFIPKNPVADLANLRPNSTIAVVIFSILIGFAILGIKKQHEDSATKAISAVIVLKDITLRLVTIVLRLTPYGIFALMTNVLARTNYTQVYSLIKFVIASYVAISIMFIIHLIIVSLFGVRPMHYIKTVFPTLLFAFTSRTSFGTIPLTVEAQHKLKVPDFISNMAASFGASMGQNACAGIYPAMLSIMIAPTLGINPLNFGFLIKLILIIVISSLGVAGIGGGATFASIIVLSALGFPIELAGLLIAVEPIIDMARTALNVNDSILSGVVTSRILGVKED